MHACWACSTIAHCHDMPMAAAAYHPRNLEGEDLSHKGDDVQAGAADGAASKQPLQVELSKNGHEQDRNV